MIITDSTVALIELLVLLSRQEKPMAATDIATAISAEVETLRKIIQFARKVGLIRTVRGHGGGVVQSKPFKSLTLWDVMQYEAFSYSRETDVAKSIYATIQESMESIPLTTFLEAGHETEDSKER